MLIDNYRQIGNCIIRQKVMDTKHISSLILYFHVSPDTIFMSLICVGIDVLTLVLNIKLVNSSHPIIMYVCIIN